MQKQCDISSQQQVETIPEQPQDNEAPVANHGPLRQPNAPAGGQVAGQSVQAYGMAIALVRAEQRERRHLAQAMHSELQQLLYSQLIQMQLMRRQLAEPNLASLTKDLDELIDQMRQTIQATRTLVLELNPPVAEIEGLVEILQWLINYMRKTYGLETRLDVTGSCRLPDAEMRSLLILGVRELLLNVVHHAGRLQAEIMLAETARGLLLTVADDGAGFDPSTLQHLPAGTSSGLFSVMARLELMGGSIAVDSTPGTGTRIALSIPLHPS
jgi:signal transduction histidine kinase